MRFPTKDPKEAGDIAIYRISTDYGDSLYTISEVIFVEEHPQKTIFHLESGHLLIKNK